ncbi:MAG: SNF2 helicase associated domain-containing protein [Firmicutes bacterium]|nr:SNF2 helicase associated domain-containing protein [Bacillota bacterium]
MHITKESLDMLVKDRWLFYYGRNPELSGRIKTISIRYKKSQNGFYYYSISANIVHHRRSEQIQFIINEYGTIIKTQCTCGIEKGRGCEHLVAVVNALNEMNLDFEKKNLDIDYEKYQRELELFRQKQRFINHLNESTQDAMDFVSSFHANKQKAMFAEQKPLMIQMELSMNYYGLVMNGRIGSDKMYVIKNMCDLVTSFSKKESVQLGKNVNLVMDEELLDEPSKKILQWIKQFCFRNGWKKDAELYKESAEEAILLAKELDEVHCLNKPVFVQEKIPVEIQEEEQYFEILSDEEEYTYAGKVAYKEADTSSRVVVNLLDEYRQTSSLMTRLKNEEFIIRKENFPVFYQEVLLPLSEHVKIFTDIDLNSFETEIKDIAVYAEMEDGSVFLWGKYKENGVEKRLFEKESVSPINIIESIIEYYADGIEKEAKRAYFRSKGNRLFDFLEKGIPLIQKEADIFISDELKALKQRKSLSFSMGVHLNNNLLEIEMNSNVDKNELMSILHAYKRRKTFYRLKNGEILNLQEGDLDKLEQASQEFDLSKKDMEKDVIKRPSYQVMHLDAYDIREDADIHMYLDKLSSLQKGVPLVLNDKYKALLHPYQIEGVRWLKELQQMDLNGILADDMGLGKTLQVLCLLDCYTKKEKPSLIVCPSSLMFNWKNEIEKFEINIDYVCVNGNQNKRKECIQEKHDLYITTYDYIKRDYEYYKNTKFEYVVLDEAQFIKNPKTQNAKSVKTIRAKHKLALTGTPIENSLSELWSIFDFLLPGYLFNYKYFSTMYERPIQLEENEEIQNRLKKMVAPFILRRTKKEVLTELPDKVEKEYWMEFSEEENQLYLANLAQVNLELQEQLKMEKVDSILILAMMTKLRQLCCEPRMVYENIKESSTKLNMCVDLVETLKEHKQKVLIFSSFTKIFDWLIEEFDKKGIKYHILTGQTSKENRVKEVDTFQNDDSDVFLISLKAGGTGLNLTAAQAVIHYDPWWNMSAQNQATDRAYRIGQTKNVLVYQLLMKNTIEEKIFQMQKRKQAMNEIFVENNSTSISKMSKEELQDLFTQ